MPKNLDMASRGRLGGLALSATHDSKEYTKPATAGFLARFYKDIDPSLPEEERDRRARAALKLHMARLGRSSAKARAQKQRTVLLSESLDTLGAQSIQMRVFGQIPKRNQA